MSTHNRQPSSGLSARTRRALIQMEPDEFAAYFFRLHALWKRTAAQQRSLDHALDITIERCWPASSGAQRRPGWVYILGSPFGYKIGRSKDVPSRLRSFGVQLPFATPLMHTIASGDMVWAEQWLHRRFVAQRIHGEWFNLTEADLAWLRSIDRLDDDGVAL